MSEPSEQKCKCCDRVVDPTEASEQGNLCHRCFTSRVAAAALCSFGVPRHEFPKPEDWLAEVLRRGDALMLAVVTTPFKKPW